MRRFPVLVGSTSMLLALSALGFAVPQAAIASVTQLSYSNATQTVVLGSAMTDAVTTPTGTPYIPQYLGQAATLTGPAGSGALAPSTVFSFANPTAVVQATTGDFYVLDAPDIRKVDKSTGAVTTLTLPGGLPTIQSNANQMGIDANNNIYVQTNNNGAAIYQLLTSAGTTPALGATITMGFGVRAMTVGPNASVYGLGYANPSAELGSVYRAVVGSATSGSISGPLWFDRSNWPGDNQWNSGPPNGVALNPAGTLLYVATGSGRVLSLGNLSGTPTSSDASQLAEGYLSNANFGAVGISADNVGNVYLAIGNCLRKAPAGNLSSTPSSLLSGSCSTTGYANGDAATSRFHFQNNGGLVADIFPAGSATGDLYLGDTSNDALRKVAASGYSISPALQTGLTFASNGTLSGTPTGSGLTTSTNVQTYTTTYTNLDNTTATANVVLTLVTPPTSLGYTTTTATLGVGTAMTPNSPTQSQGSQSLGLPAPTYTVSPALPAGLTLNSSTGTISGTPTAISASTVYTVTATNAYGSTTAQVTLAVVALLPPNPPNFVAVGRGDAMLTATVDPDLSGSVPTSYEFSATPSIGGAVAATCTAVAPATTCVLTGLTNSTNYDVSVVSRNAGGDSSPAVASNAQPRNTAATSPPGTPGAPIAVAGQGQATVTITGPTGGSSWAAVTYNVTSSPAGGSCTVTVPALSCTVTGLTAGTSYTFSATGTNAAGSSSASPASNSVTPTSPTPPTPPAPPTPVTPSAPGSVAVTPGNGSASVSWTPPSILGTFAVTQYRAIASPGGASCLVPATATSCTVSPLANGTTYTVSVSALSGAGWGAAATSAPFTPGASAPTTPSVTLVLAGNGAATVSVAAGPGGGPVTSYLVAASPGGATCTVTTPATSCQVTGLVNGTAYTFTATATGPGGTSGASGSSAPVTPVAPITPTPAPLPGPLAPGQSNLQQGGQTVPVTVTPNSQSTGLVVTAPGFTMTLQGENGQGRPLPLSNGVLVLEQDRTLRTTGTGFFPNTDVDLYLNPPAIGDGSMLRVNEGATLLGTVPTDSLGDFGGTVQIDPSVGVGDHVVQAIGVTQGNVERAMSLGVRVEAAAATRPGPVRDLKVVSKTKSTVKVSWKTPLDDGGTPITKYKVRHRLMGDERYQGKLQVTGLAATVKGLTPGKTYYIRVKAVNAVGTGPSGGFVKVRLPR